MPTHDVNGRPYAKLSELNADDQVEIDDGFTCMKDKGPRPVRRNAHGLYITCSHGQHYLAGQADDGEHCIGIYKVLQ